MHNDDLGEEMARRENDRHGNAPLRRGPDPEKVARHLAGGEGESLIAAKKTDGFTTESPIRAFTDFRVSGSVAIGKGFRPSMAHLHTYLDAMERKEGWVFVQVLLPRDTDGDPTIMFHKADDTSIYQRLAADVMTPGEAERTIGMSPALGMGYGSDAHVEAREKADAQRRGIDDPVNPSHYAGWECGDIGERLSANGYQILKYVWRLGKKDDPCKEIGKAIRYCEREIELLNLCYPGERKHLVYPNVRGLGTDEIDAFLEDRIADQPDFTKRIARMLWEGYDQQKLASRILPTLDEHRFHLDCGRGLAI